MAGYGGWAGKTLRLDLSSGTCRTEDTIEKYKDFLGRTGIGYKIMWDEVKPGTKPFDAENGIIFGVGPLAGTGAPTAKGYRDAGLGDVADEQGRRKLLPARGARVF